MANKRHPFQAWARRRRGGHPTRPLSALTAEQRTQLEALDALRGRLGRMPMREELPPCLRLALADCFGSLSAAFLHARGNTAQPSSSPPAKSRMEL